MKSALAIVSTITNLHDQGLITKPHCKEILKIALWKLTTAEVSGKHRTRFCSEKVHEEPKQHKLNHDHVQRCALAIERLMEPNPKDALVSVENMVGCTVTLDEHTKLTEADRKHAAMIKSGKAKTELDGWDRYKRAGITVLDRSTEPPAKLFG